MARRHLIREKADEYGVSEIDLLKEALQRGGYKQRKAALWLNVSQSAISEALKRLKFIRVVQWLPESEIAYRQADQAAVNQKKAKGQK